MVQSTTITLDSELMIKFESLCKKFGTNINSAVNTLVRNAVKSEKIDLREDEIEKACREFGEIFEKMRAQASSLPEMSLEEINEEIAQCRAGYLTNTL